MTIAPDLTRLRHSLTEGLTDSTPVYALVGATDLAVGIVRDARERAVAARSQIDVSHLPERAVAGAGRIAGAAQHVPASALEGTRALTERVQDSYEQLADRGHRLVSRVRGQQATQDLLTQASSTVSRGKGAVTSVRKAAVDTRRSAKATVTTARRDATAVKDEVADEVGTARTRARKTTASTTSAAKRTTTTARKRGANAQRATKAATTSARKTVSAAEKAAGAAAGKIGD